MSQNLDNSQDEFIEIDDLNDLDSIKFDKQQYKQHEENLNLKISTMLSIFEKLNLTLEMYDEKFFDYFEKLRNYVVNVLNEIVDNYVYVKPGQEDQTKKYKQNIDRLKRENQVLKNKIFSIQQSENEGVIKNLKSSKSAKKQEEQVTSFSQKNQSNISYKIPNNNAHQGNDLLKWKAKDFNKPLYNLAVKKLTYNQVSDIIQDIYKGKQEFNEKCKQQQKPIETMEQYTYNYFKQKYGLNKMVIEQFFALMEGVKNFSGKDPEIALFGLILKNEVDEDFQEIILQIKLTLKDLVLGILEEENPQKSKNFLFEQLEKKTCGYIDFDYALKIINLMYSDENPKKRDILEKLTTEMEKNKREKGNNKIGYIFLQKNILKNQIKTHKDYLENLRRLFIEFDDQQLGYIDNENFEKILHRIDDQNSLDVETIIKQIDPSNTNQITFSQIVNSCTNIKISIEQSQEKVNLLQLVYSM